jgi:hypothetical protein
MRSESRIRRMPRDDEYQSDPTRSNAARRLTIERRVQRRVKYDARS